MASPQAEDGHTDIANEIIEHLASVYLSGSEFRVVMVVFRKTYGWNKSEDAIPLTQFQALTGLPRWTVWNAIEGLVSKRLLVRKSLPRGSIYRFNKDWEIWGGSKQTLTSKEKPTKLVSKPLHSKETQKTRSTKIPLCIPPKGGPPKKRACTLPSNFSLSDSLCSWSLRKGPTLNIEEEVDQFKDYHLAKGSLMKDWEAAFRTWIRNAIKFGAGKRSNSAKATSVEVIEFYQSELAKEEQGEESDVFGRLEGDHEDVSEAPSES